MPTNLFNDVKPFNIQWEVWLLCRDLILFTLRVINNNFRQLQRNLLTLTFSFTTATSLLNNDYMRRNVNEIHAITTSKLVK